jgi:RES domain-containing protein
MLVYRIASTRYIDDLSGTGARLHGGRWNRKGTAVIYTATNRALATVEYLVHLPLSLLPNDLSIVTLEIPDRIHIKAVELGALPPNWRDYPAPPTLGALGTEWAMAFETLLLRVPSAVVEHEWNMLINPGHPEMTQVQIAAVEPYSFDARLLR